MQSDKYYYIRSFAFSLLLFAANTSYLSFQHTPNILNRAVADTAIILIGLSMLLTSLCYFWDFADSKIIYRKFLGLVGFFYGLVHIILSLDSFLLLFSLDTWVAGNQWPLISGSLALIILVVVALISNKYAAYKLGGVKWKKILRTGYYAVGLVWIHVFLIRFSQLASWFSRGMPTTPPISLFLLIFMFTVIFMRLLLWFSVIRKKIALRSTASQSS